MPTFADAIKPAEIGVAFSYRIAVFIFSVPRHASLIHQVIAAMRRRLERRTQSYSFQVMFSAFRKIRPQRAQLSTRIMNARRREVGPTRIR
jgi:hypothetical protein